MNDYSWAIDRLQDMLDEADQSFDIDALELAIKSIEAWEKVKKEIKQIRIHNGYLDVQGVTIIEVLEIIDKHLAEVENDT